jgi:hypothetical protein
LWDTLWLIGYQLGRWAPGENGDFPGISTRQLTVVPAAKTPRISASVATLIVVPAIVADAGKHAARRFLEFFAATIRNKNTRTAYLRAASQARSRQSAVVEDTDFRTSRGLDRRCSSNSMAVTGSSTASTW